MKKQIEQLSQELCHHPLYKELTSIDKMQTFMHYHSFAVYDFMCLLKSLKNHVSMNDTFWKPTSYPHDIVRFVNEIFLGEETDLGQDGKPISHFMLYMKAMKELGADSNPVLNFIHSVHGSTFHTNTLPKGIKEFVHFNMELALTGKIEEVAGAFLFGREKLIPDMFRSIIQVLAPNKDKYPSFFYYLERHVEVDEGDHGPKAELCLQAICGNDQQKWENAYKASKKSLELRKKLWDECLLALN